MKLTITRITDLHRTYRCRDYYHNCPVCRYGDGVTREKNAAVRTWLEGRGLTVVTDGQSSPHWTVREGIATVRTALR